MNDNKKIAFNTIILTIKLVITIVCGFIVSRLVLRALGADNYGLYNVVGGIVAIMTIVSTSMVPTSYRYIAVERGKGIDGDTQKVYSTLMLIHLSLAVLLLLIGLPLGNYYIEHYLNITNASVDDAYFVFFFSLIAAFFTIVAVPSNGLLIAEEKFLPMAIIDICNVFLHIVMTFILLEFLGNRLCLYAVFMAVLSILNRMAYHFYCRYQYPNIVKFKFNYSFHDYKGMLSFTSWILLGAIASIGRTQGVAMVINLFFRNSVNGAFGVGSQIGNAASKFTNTLRQAVIPQIMKNQASNSTRSLTLVYVISRYTYLIMLVVSVPLLLYIDTILQIWLGVDNIPPLTNMFAIFLLVNGMISNLGSGFDACIQATGKIRKNQIGYSIINLSIIPIVYVLYKVGFPAYMNVVVGCLLTLATLVFQTYIMKLQTDFTYYEYLNRTIAPSISTTFVAFLPLILLKYLIDDNFYVVLGLAFFSIVWTSLSILFVGMNRIEQESLLLFVKSKMHNIIRANN